MQYNTATLPNGLRIIHRQDSSPVVYCGYAISAGTRDELPGEEGMAHFCEHVTFKGTARRSALRIINSLESVGGELNAFTTKEHTVYYAAILKDHVRRAADLLTDIVFHSTYPQAETEKEVAVICDEIESYNDSPAELIYDDFENIIFSGHPLGHNILGQADRLRTYGPEDARRFTAARYRPCNAVFFACGDISFSSLTTFLRRATSDFAPAEPLPVRTAGAALPEYTAGVHVVNRGTHQSHVLIGSRAYSMHDSRRMALCLLSNMLGGPGMNARLNIALRERNALVYTVDSSIVSYSDTGMWCIYFGCDPHDTSRCRRLVHRELDRMASRPLSEARLAAAKRQIKGQIAVACDNRESFALDVGKTFLHYGRGKDIAATFDRIDALTPEDLRRTAEELFAPELTTTLIYK